MFVDRAGRRARGSSGRSSSARDSSGRSDSGRDSSLRGLGEPCCSACALGDLESQPINRQLRDDWVTYLTGALAFGAVMKLMFALDKARRRRRR